MSSQRRNGVGLSNRKYRARFESLEQRQCLSASALKLVAPVKPAVTTTPPPATVTTSGHTLTVKDTEAGDTITVTDDGMGDVSVNITNNSGSVATGSGTGIHSVVINTTGGDDTVDYTFGAVSAAKPAIKPPASSSSNFNESICMNLGKGGNTVDFTDAAGLTDINLSLSINASGGSNTITETFGALSSSKLFNWVTAGGSSTNTPNNTVTTTLTGGLTSSQAFFAELGGSGDDSLNLSVTGEIDAESLLTAELGGGFKGGDTIDFIYSGILDGKLYAGTTGTGGDESLSQNITVADGSTGSLYSLMAAGKGSSANTFDYTLTDDSGGSGTAASTLKHVGRHDHSTERRHRHADGDRE